MCALAALSLAFVAGCQSSNRTFADLPDPDLNPPPPISSYATNSLTEGDLVGVTFQYSTNFNLTQKVTLDGTLNFETIGPVKVAGLTPLQLQEKLAALYKPQVKNDVVTVRVLAAASSIYVSGAVMRPGKVPLDRPMTVLEGIMEGGGFDPNRAKLSGVTVIRLEGGRQRRYVIDVRKVLKGTDQDPFYLKPFDIVHVPLKTFNF
jgi:polysaccharide export outer membrane protein